MVMKVVSIVAVTMKVAGEYQSPFLYRSSPEYVESNNSLGDLRWRSRRTSSYFRRDGRRVE
jgi:hypothetical protein